MIRIAHNFAARRLAVVGLAAVLLYSCQGTETPSGIEGTGGSPPPTQYTVGGSVGGLIGSGLVLQDNGGNDLALTSNGSFVFSTPVMSGAPYAVTIETQPTNPAQTCVLTAGTGAVTDANVSNVVVTCTVSPGRFLYVGGSQGIYCYAVDAVTGALTALASSPCDSGDRVGVASDPADNFVYSTLNILDTTTVPPSLINSDATAYTINSSTGSLTTVAGSPYVGGGDNCVDITVDPSGKFVYMANYAGRNNSGASISAFTINSVTGGLTSVPGSPFATAPPIPPNNNSGANSVTVDPTGKFVYVALNGSNAISAFTIDSSTGALTTVVGSPFPAGSVPYMVRVDPSGRFAYATNHNSDDISAYSINSSTGALTPITGSPFPFPTLNGAPSGLAVDLSGRFLYATDSNLNYVVAFSIDNSTGALTPLPGSPFASGAGPWGAFVHPSGKFLYVTNNGEGTISAYAIDSSSGSLTPISGSPFVASGNGTDGVYAIAFSN